MTILHSDPTSKDLNYYYFSYIYMIHQVTNLELPWRIVVLRNLSIFHPLISFMFSSIMQQRQNVKSTFVIMLTPLLEQEGKGGIYFCCKCLAAVDLHFLVQMAPTLFSFCPRFSLPLATFLNLVYIQAGGSFPSPLYVNFSWT